MLSSIAHKFNFRNLKVYFVICLVNFGLMNISFSRHTHTYIYTHLYLYICEPSYITNRSKNKSSY